MRLAITNHVHFSAWLFTCSKSSALCECLYPCPFLSFPIMSTILTRSIYKHSRNKCLGQSYFQSFDSNCSSQAFMRHHQKLAVDLYYDCDLHLQNIIIWSFDHFVILFMIFSSKYFRNLADKRTHIYINRGKNITSFRHVWLAEEHRANGVLWFIVILSLPYHSHNEAVDPQRDLQWPVVHLHSCWNLNPMDEKMN